MTTAERDLLMALGTGLMALLQRGSDAASVAAATRIANAMQAVHSEPRAMTHEGFPVEHRGIVR